jgi:hypothetical protein
MTDQPSRKTQQRQNRRASGRGQPIVGLLAGGIGSAGALWTAVSIVDADVVGTLVGAVVVVLAVGVAGLGLLLVEQLEQRSHQTEQIHAANQTLLHVARELAASRRSAEQTAAALERLARWLMVSPESRTILAMPHEQRAFQEAIQEAFAAEQWEQAARMIEAMEQRLGLTAQARALRGHLQHVRAESRQRQANQLIEQIRERIAADAFIEADQALVAFREMFPTDARVQELGLTIRTARRQRREELRSRFEQALAASDLGASEQALDRLQQLLSDQELADLRIRLAAADRQMQIQLRDHFAELVRTRCWAEALAQADEILRRYPQAAMAADIRKVYDQLVERARGTTGEMLSFPTENQQPSSSSP